MQNVPRILISTFLGALLCAGLSALLFAMAAILDGTRPSEALAFAVVVGVVAAFFGALIGMAVGVANLGLIGGGIAELLATAGAVAFYVLTFGRPNQYGYFLSESAVIVVALALPTILTGVLTAWLKNAILRL